MNISPLGQSTDDNIGKQQDQAERYLSETAKYLERLNRSVSEFKAFNKYAREFLDSAKNPDKVPHLPLYNPLSEHPQQEPGSR